MKRRKRNKVISLLMAVIMMLGLCNVAMAADDKGTITIKDTESGYTYNLYKIFALTGEDTDNDSKYDNVAYTIDSDWVDFFFGTGALGSAYLVEKTTENASTYSGYNSLTYDNKVYFMNISNTNIVDFAEAALKYVINKNITYDKTVTGDGSDITINDLSLGYYLVYPYGASILNCISSGSICSLTSTVPDAEVLIKAEWPDIEKDEEKESVEVGYSEPYKITGKVPDTTGYTTYTYRVTDEMSTGLTFDGISSINVTFDEIDSSGNVTASAKIITSGLDGNDAIGGANSLSVSSAGNGFVLTLDMTKYQTYVGRTVTITYFATVNSDAVVKISANKAKLEYSNNPNDSTSTDETEEIEKVYSARITIDKYEEGNTSKKLSGAVFKLYRLQSDNTTKEYYQGTYDQTSGKLTYITWVTDIDDATKFTTDSNGAVNIDGLEDGIYYLVETEAPTGYNLLTDATTVTISHDLSDLEAMTDGEVVVALTSTAEVANNTGTTLPGTGGIGTTIFYVVGVILMFGAAVMLVTKIRVGKEK